MLPLALFHVFFPNYLIQELEEEHEQIAVELQQVMLENKRLNEKIQHYESSGELKDQPNSKVQLF